VAPHPPAARERGGAPGPRRAGRANAVVLRVRGDGPLAAALRISLVTRLLIAAVAILAAPRIGSAGRANASEYDVRALTHALGGFGDALLAPLARWDAVWYLSIAHGGYGAASGGVGDAAVFFPLYPFLIRVVSGLGLVSSPGALLVSAYAVSLAALAAALYLLHRLVTLELGSRFAQPALLLSAVFPGALYFGAPYSESVFLLVSVGAFYAARTGRWAWAGAFAAAASATRSAGLLLLVPLAILYLYGPRADRPEPGRREGWARRLRPRHPIRADAAWLALAPAGLVAYTLFLGVGYGDAFAYLHLQEGWYREFAGPFGGAWDGAVAAWDGLRQLASGSGENLYFAGRDPSSVAVQNLTLFGFLVFAAVATIGVFRRLPPAYGAYVLAALALPLSYPAGPQPLMSLPRFLAVLFPLFMWLALVCEERRRSDLVIACLALILGLFTTQFATWQWVA
jgi:mannosyltransferase PIG-V